MYSRPESSTSRPPTSLLPRRTASMHRLERRAVRRERVGVDGHLVLAHLAADGGHLGDAGHALHGVAQEPVLVAAQLVAGVLAGPVDQRVLEDPADAGGVGTELGLHARGQLGGDLGQVLEHAGARPVDVGAVLEDDVDVAEAEVGEAADGLDLRRAQERRDDRIGDLVLDDVGAAVPARVDDHLGVGEVRQRVERDVAHRPERDDERDHRPGDDEVPVLGGEADDPLDHGVTSPRWRRARPAAATRSRRGSWRA